MSIEPEQQFAPPPSQPPETDSSKAIKRQLQQNATSGNTKIQEGEERMDQLSPLQQQALMLMLAGQRDTLIASRLGVHRSTLWRWRNRCTEFRAAMRELCRGHWALAESRVSRMVSSALGVFHEALHCDNDDYRIKVATTVFKSAARVLIHRPSAGSCDRNVIRNELIEEGIEPDDTIDTQPAVKLKKLKPKPKAPKWPIYPIPTKKQACGPDGNPDDFDVP